MIVLHINLTIIVKLEQVNSLVYKIIQPEVFVAANRLLYEESSKLYGEFRDLQVWRQRCGLIQSFSQPLTTCLHVFAANSTCTYDLDLSVGENVERHVELRHPMS